MIESNSVECLQNCLALLEKSYNDAGASLEEQYGPVTDAFFHEQSYHNFFRRLKDGETPKRIIRGSYSRQAEGVYTHHVKESQYPNLSSSAALQSNHLEYEIQQKSNLVYCNLAKHLVLHALIANEEVKQRGEFGLGGISVILVALLRIGIFDSTILKILVYSPHMRSLFLPMRMPCNCLTSLKAASSSKC